VEWGQYGPSDRIFDQRTAQILPASLDSAFVFPSCNGTPPILLFSGAVPFCSTPMASLAITALRLVGSKVTGATITKPWKPASQCACVSGGHEAELQVLAAEAEQMAVSEAPRFRWDAFGSDLSESQERSIRGLSPKLPNRCKALMTRVVCLSPGDENLGALLAYWVKAMKPKRADWLLVLKELKAVQSPLLAEVSDTDNSEHFAT